MSKSNLVNFKSSENPKKAHNKNRNVPILIGTVIILVITVVAFVLSPVVSAFATKSSSAVFGHWDGENIEYNPGNYFTSMIERVNDQYSDNPVSDDLNIQRQVVWRTAFNQSVFHYAMKSFLDSDNIIISDDMIDRVIVNYSSFLDSSGNFSPRLYNELSVVEKEDLRQNISENLIDSYFTTYQFNNQLLSNNELSFLKDFGKTERKINFIFLDSSVYPDSSIMDFAIENTELFSKYRASRILYSGTEDEINQIITQIEDGVISFTEAATTYSSDNLADDGGDLGSLYAFQIKNQLQSDEDFADFTSLQAGDVSRAFTTASGWAIYKLQEAPIAADFNDENTISDVKSYMATYESGMIQEYINNLAVKIKEDASTSDFSTACTNNGVTMETSEFFPMNYGNLPFFFLPTIDKASENENFASLSSNKDFFSEVFTMELNEISQPIVSGRSILVIQPIEEQINEEVAVEEGQTEEVDPMDAYYEYQIKQAFVDYKQSILNDVILSSEKLDDNFYATYRKLFPES